MQAEEELIQEIKSLPIPLQEATRYFVGYLKMELAKNSSERKEWNQFSLASALRGMEDDEFPDYQETDFKEVWK